MCILIEIANYEMGHKKVKKEYDVQTDYKYSKGIRLLSKLPI